MSVQIEEYHKTSECIRYLARRSNLVAPKRKCRASQLLQFVDGTRKSMFMGFRTEQSYGQVQRELKKNWVVAGNTNVLFNSNDSNL